KKKKAGEWLKKLEELENSLQESKYFLNRKDEKLKKQHEAMEQMKVETLKKDDEIEAWKEKFQGSQNETRELAQKLKKVTNTIGYNMTQTKDEENVQLQQLCQTMEGEYEEELDILTEELDKRTEAFQIEIHKLQKMLEQREHLTQQLSLREERISISKAASARSNHGVDVGAAYNQVTKRKTGVGVLSLLMPEAKPVVPANIANSVNNTTEATNANAPTQNVVCVFFFFLEEMATRKGDKKRQREKIYNIILVCLLICLKQEEVASKEETLIQRSLYLEEMNRNRRTAREEIAKNDTEIGKEKETPVRAPSSPSARSGDASLQKRYSTALTIRDKRHALQDDAFEGRKKETLREIAVAEEKLKELQNNPIPVQENQKLEVMLNVAAAEDNLSYLRKKYAKIVSIEKKRTQRKERGTASLFEPDMQEKVRSMMATIEQEDNTFFSNAAHENPPIAEQQNSPPIKGKNASRGSRVFSDLAMEAGKEFAKMYPQIKEENEEEKTTYCFLCNTEKLTHVFSPIKEKNCVIF
ncbi:viral A-type inclusion protein, partial [Reticulomyxa filosa]